MNILKLTKFSINMLLAMSIFTLTAFGQGKSFTNPETGQLHKFVSGNYTDLGVDFNGNMPSSESSLRSNARTELNRLSNAGISSVRIWAFLGYNANDFGKMANRVAWLAEEAAQKNMTLVVDLFDSANNNSFQNISSNDGRLTNLINNIIPPNANRANIYWSLGNEIGGFENPLAFATFYENKVAEMRAAGASHISFHPVPGSLEHRWGGDTEQAARRCIAVSDDVSPHFYARGAVGNEGSANGTEFNSMQQYINIGHELCKVTTIGEFGIIGTCDDNYAQRTGQNVSDWLSYFDNTLKVDQVSFWQFMKNTTGHLDNESFASVPGNCIGNGTHEDAMSGYLNDTPSNPGSSSCGGNSGGNTGGNTGGSGNPNDTDGDGIWNDWDQCPNDATNQCNGNSGGNTGGSTGGSGNPNDTDGDGIWNEWDECPNDATNQCNGNSGGNTGGSTGGSGNPNDTDGDGIWNEWDECPNDATNQCNGNGGGSGNSNDTDGDGIWNEWDECPNDATNQCNTSGGGSGNPNDTDGDGIWNDWDKCPNDASNQCRLISNEKSITIFPNPFMNDLNVSIKNIKDITTDFLTIQITDIVGKNVYNNKFTATANSFNINTTSFTKGVYLARITDNSGNSVGSYKITK